MVWKPSEREEEHFARLEFERNKKLEEERHKNLAEEEKKRLKELHYMKCPKWMGWKPLAGFREKTGRFP